MSLSSALSNAASGLNANSKQADLIANNIANAQTPGYTRRAAELGAVALGGQGDGVRILGVTLVEDPAAIANRRQSDAALGAETAASVPLQTLSNSMGLPGSGTAFATLAGEFEIALTASANEPTSGPRLDNAVTDAGRLVDKVVGLAGEAQELRATADGNIARGVDSLNTNLAAIQKLNGEIVSLSISGADTSALLDQRKGLIDEVASLVPVREVVRNNGEVALFTTNGAALLDGRASDVGFTPTPLITQDMTRASGALSGLTLNGQPVTVGAPDQSGFMDGGTLGALFVTRDETLPQYADQLDLLAEDMVVRFQDPAIDATRAPGSAGLFTDNGGAYDPVDLEGLAGRLGLNAAV
ncbi:MAG: flagellar basal body protein, partial [Pseudomonadota bacterium]